MHKKIAMAGLLVLLFLWIPFLVSCDRPQDAGLWVYADRCLLFSTENGPMLQQAQRSGSVKLAFYNNTNSDAQITLYTDATEEGKVLLSAAAGESATLRLTLPKKTELCDGIRLVQEETDHTYILSDHALQRAGTDGVPNITLLRDISLDGELTFSAPASLSTDGHALSVSDVVSFICQDPGTLSLSGDISADGLYVRAPDCDIIVPDTLIPENIPFQIAAASLNDMELDGTVTAGSMEELANLAQGASYMQAAADTPVRLGAFAVEEQVVFTKPVTLIDDGVSLKAPILIETQEQGEIRLEGNLPWEKVLLKAPDCDLLWEDYGPTLHVAQQLYDIASYNGADPDDYVLGGDCDGVPQISLIATENACITKDIVWSTEGKAPFVLGTQMDGVLAPSVLKAADLTVVPPADCTVTFVGPGVRKDGAVDLLSSLGCYFTVSDGSTSSLYYMETSCKSLLPVVCIETDSGEAITSKDEYVSASISIESDFSDGLPSLQSSPVQIRGRGNTTWEWSDKRPYKLKFDQNVSLLGLRSGKKWVLLANFSDKSLIRNYVALESAKVLDNMDCYATQYPVDVFVNGEYVGVYTLGEQVEAGGDRLFIREDAGNVNTGFLLELGVSRESGQPVFSSSILKNIGVLQPENVDEQTLTYIQNYVSVADQAVKYLQDYDVYIDVPSLIDWFIMTEFSYNADSCFRRSVFLTKSAGDKLRLSQVWDFDLAFGNNVADLEDYQRWACLATDNGYVRYNWMCELMKDEAFVERLRQRWNTVKEPLLEAAMAAIDEGYRLTAPSADDNFAKWNILYEQVGMEPYNIVQRTTHASQVEFLREFIQQRWNWMDGELNADPQA